MGHKWAYIYASYTSWCKSIVALFSISPHMIPSSMDWTGSFSWGKYCTEQKPRDIPLQYWLHIVSCTKQGMSSYEWLLRNQSRKNKMLRQRCKEGEVMAAKQTCLLNCQICLQIFRSAGVNWCDSKYLHCTCTALAIQAAWGQNIFI